VYVIPKSPKGWRHLWLVGKRVVNFLLALIELLSLLRRYERILVEIVVFEREMGHFER